MQKCLTFQFGLDPVKLGNKGLGTDRQEFASYAQKCAPIVQQDLARDSPKAKTTAKNKAKKSKK